jgi:hypothetical protein
MTTLSFHTTVPSDCTITLPSEFRGVPVRIVVKQEPTQSPVEKRTMKKGILGLRGILKDYTLEELENARDEYLADKYIHD